jgi:pheromone shutdown protein TraB
LSSPLQFQVEKKILRSEPQFIKYILDESRLDEFQNDILPRLCSTEEMEKSYMIIGLHTCGMFPSIFSSFLQEILL